MTLRIGHKIALIGLALIALTALVTFGLVDRAQRQTIDREFVDLGDEAIANGARLLESIRHFREELIQLALSVAQLSMDDSTADATNFRRQADNRFADDETGTKCLQLAMVEFSAAEPGEITVIDAPDRNGRSHANSVACSEIPESFRKRLADATNVFDVAVSDVVEISNEPNEPNEPRESHSLESTNRRFGLWTAVRLPDSKPESEPAGGSARFVLGMLNLTNELRDLDQSPRHLTFLSVGHPDDRDFVLHPFRPVAGGNRFEIPSGPFFQVVHSIDYIDAGMQELSRPARELASLGAGTAAASGTATDTLREQLEVEQERLTSRGWRGELAEIVHPVWYCQSEKLPDELQSDEARLRAVSVLIKNIRDEQTAVRSPVFRLSDISRTVLRFRLRAASQQELTSVQREISDRVLQETGITVRWQQDVECEHFTAHFWKVPFDPDHPDRYLTQIQAVSTEEIKSEIRAASRDLVWYSWLGFGLAAVLTVFFSIRLTNALTQITIAAERFGLADVDSDSWNSSVERIAQSLRTDRQDEVGVLSRTFRQMIDVIGRTGSDLRDQRNLLDERVERRTAELRQLTVDLRHARDEALRSKDAMQVFLAQMSHELRTPLNAIIGYSEYLLEESEDDGQDEYKEPLENVIRAGRHLASIINDVLDISKILAGEMTLAPEDLDVATLVREVVATVQPQAEKNRNQLTFECDDPGAMHSDGKRIRQVLLNLLSNACKFTSDGRIHVRVVREQVAGAETIAFHVRDTGIGMTPEQLVRVFEPFRQADSSTTRKFGGTGLGLAISRRFCELMGGELVVVSEPAKGSEFTARWPVVTTANQPGSKIASSLSDSTMSPTAKSKIRSAGTGLESADDGKPTILVIDDDPTVHDLVRRNLEHMCHVVVAGDGRTGIQLARDLRPLFITLDVMMPDMDGWTVLSRIKSDSTLCEIPVVMLTIVDDRDMGFALGATDYLTKPIDRNRLRSVVERLIANRNGEHQVLIIDDDPAARDILRRQMADCGWSVTEADNGKIGLERIAAGRPDLILLDLMMPEMDGFDFLDELRRHDENRQIPVVVVTARDLHPQDIERLSGGVNRILEKGQYNRDDLLNELKLLVHKANGG